MAIKAKVKARSGCEVVVECEVPRPELEAAYERTYKDVQRYVELPGFRRGHAPRELVEQRFGRMIRQQTVEDVIVEVVRQVVRQHGLQVIGGVKGAEDVFYPESGALKFVVEFEVKPRVKVTGYEGLVLKKRKVEVTEQDVNEAIRSLLEREATYEVVKEPRGAVFGDWLVVDYVGKVGEEEVLKREEVWVEVSTESQAPVPGFGAQLAGAQKGETKRFSVTVPPEFAMKRIAGKTVEFTVQVRELYERRIPALTDEVAQRLVPTCKTVEELREAVRKNHAHYLEAVERGRLRALAREELVRRHAIAVPPSEIAGRARRYMENEVRQRMQRGATEEEIRAAWKEIEEQARRLAENDLRAAYVLDAIAEEQKLTVTEEELMEHLASYARSFRKDVRWVRAIFERDGLIEQTKHELLQEKALDYVVDHAVISEE